MFQGCLEGRAFFRVVAQPVQQLGESPLVRVDAAAPFDPFEAKSVRLLRNLLRLGKGAMVAPQVILVQRFQALAHRNHAGAGSVQRNGRNVIPINAGSLERIAGGAGERRHLVCVGLGGKVRVFATAVQRIGGRRSSDRALPAVD